MAIKLKDSFGAWKDVAAVYLRNATGTWKALSSAYVKNSTGWKEIFSLAIPSIQYTVTISSSSSLNPSILTGTNYHWYNISGNPKYVFQKSTDASTWTDIGSATTISNPSTGLSNTVTYTTKTSDFSQNDMYFRFSVYGTNAAGTVYTSSSAAVMVSLTTTTSPTTTTAAPTLPNCPGQYTNPTSYTCADLGLTYLGNSTQYNIPNGWDCCGDALPVETGLTPVISDGVYINASSVKFSVTNYNSLFTWTPTTYTPSGTLINYTITSNVVSSTQIDYTVSGIVQTGVILRVTTSRTGYTTVYAEKSYTFPSIQVTNVVASSGADNGTGRKLSLSWTNVSGITRYMLQFAQDGTFNWTYAYNISNPYTSNFYYPYGTTYKMYVYGTDSQDNILNGSQSALTYWTPSATPTTTTAAPTTTTAAPTTTTAAPTTTTAAPTTTTAAPSFGITSTSSTSNSITYGWSNAPGLTAFYGVYYRKVGGTYSSVSIVTGTSQTYTGLSASTTYEVVVEARNSSNATLASASTTITTTAASTTTTTAAPATTTTAAPATTTTAAPATTTTSAPTTTTAAPASYWTCSRSQLINGNCCSNGLGGPSTCWSGGAGSACATPTCS